MKKTTMVLALLSMMGLTACLNDDVSCGIAGAAGGAVLADALGGDALVGAAVGGAAGALANDVNPNVCN
jgi:osmotically inducible lipoprotein OsmB